MARRLTVSQLNSYIKGMFFDELLLHDIEVCGEITEFSISNGNTFFSLIENGCILSCRKFSVHELLPIGLRVAVSGSVSFYEKGGRVNFIVKNITPYGEGEQYLKFLQIKKRLSEEGCFECAKPLPEFINSVALVTSMTGAVLHDFISVNKKRRNINITVFDTRVQGENADKEIISALETAETLKDRFDCVIIARGGGANTDLECFNSEALARKVARFPLPVISAVGHETDYTLCDLCASARAGTPSIAAEIVSRINDACFERVYSASQKLSGKIGVKYQNAEGRLYRLISGLSESAQKRQSKANSRLERLIYRIDGAVEHRAARGKNYIDDLVKRANLSIDNMLSLRQVKFALNETLLQKSNPLKILKSGYALVIKDNIPIKSISALERGDKIDILLSDGKARAEIVYKKRIGET